MTVLMAIRMRLPTMVRDSISPWNSALIDCRGITGVACSTAGGSGPLCRDTSASIADRDRARLPRHVPWTRSESVDDYLKAILELGGAEDSRVTTNALAARLAVRTPSVTGMLQKLALQRPALVLYEKHRGVRLTAAGKRRAWELVKGSSPGLGRNDRYRGCCRKGAVSIGINRVMEGEVAARPVGAAPGVQVLAVQIRGLTITIAGHAFHVFHEVADLVKTVPGGNLNYCPGARLRNVQCDLHPVRFRRPQIHCILNRLGRFGGAGD